MSDKILITLATGTTGYAITQELLRASCPVRIFVRTRNQRARELESQGAEVALGQFDNAADWQAALAGVRAVYYCYPIKKGLPASLAVFIRAAQAASPPPAVVFMGQWLAEFDDQTSLLTNDIRRAYGLLRASDLPVVYYNPGFFADNLLPFTESVVQLGLLPSPFGRGRCPWVSTGDLARVAAVLLQNPAPYLGQKVHPTGPACLDAPEMAAAYGRVLRRRVRVLPVPDWLFRKAVVASAAEFGTDAFLAVQADLYNQQLRRGRFAEGGPTDVVHRLTGRAPEDFDAIVRQQLESSPYGRRTPGGWWRALRKFLVLPLQPAPGRAARAALNRA